MTKYIQMAIIMVGLGHVTHFYCVTQLC